ncbi:hypothetical protein, conserved [Plasmodium gonderi]|uniref:CWC16 domain-containing protein n=1 Tax=Plasmodium gonderi TaxID=77519 RepID=A0A1Y1JKM0_PLAGO|nr:hypothetical protein, conserved [Plasmodium gonderi]GAW80574.1 hypothetical protein, conserved [Plasmodium gonderi]
MAERKVLNKYIPPDFDPEKLEERKKLMRKIEKKRNRNNKYNKKKKHFLNIRMMYPFTLKCIKCKTFTYVGTKFNSRVEKLKDENYLNIPIWKFYGKCFECKNEIIFKTDPKNGDYILISGGIRTYDAHKEQEIADDYYRENNIIKEEDKLKNTEKESYNALLELKTNEQLEELQNINKRHIDKFNSINKALHKLYEKKGMENTKNNFFMNSLDPEDQRAFFNLLSRSRRTTDQTWGMSNAAIEEIQRASKPEDEDVIIEVLEEGDDVETENKDEESNDEESNEEESNEEESNDEESNEEEDKKEESKKEEDKKEESKKEGNNEEENTNSYMLINPCKPQESPFHKKNFFEKNVKKRKHNSNEVTKANMDKDIDESIKVNQKSEMRNVCVKEMEGSTLKHSVSTRKNKTMFVNSPQTTIKKNFEKNYNFIIKKKEDLSSIFNEYNSDSDQNLDHTSN